MAMEKEHSNSFGESDNKLEGGYGIQAGDDEPVVRKKSKICSGAVVRMMAATVCIAISVATWVASAEALQSLNKNYEKPFFLIWFVHSWYGIMYIVWAAWRYFPYIPGHRGFFCNSIGDGALTDSTRLIVWSGILAFLALGSGYVWTISLGQTNIPANTAIYQCSSAFVFIISIPLLKERVTLLKISCVLFSISGVFMVAFFSTDIQCLVPATNYTINGTFDNSSIGELCENAAVETSTPFGYIMLLTSIVSYSLFEVLYKKFATQKDDKAASLNGLRVVGYMGVTTLFMLWPPIIVLHFTGYEKFELPATMELFGLLVLNAALDIVMHACILVGIALSSPLYVTVGSVVTIPASVLVDYFIQHFVPSTLAFVGIVLILAGFFGFVVSEMIQIRRESKHEKQIQQQQVNSSKSDNDELTPLLSKAQPQKKTVRARIVKFLV